MQNILMLLTFQNFQIRNITNVTSYHLICLEMIFTHVYIIYPFHGVILSKTHTALS